jgi:hypothetical protein
MVKKLLDIMESLFQVWLGTIGAVALYLVGYTVFYYYSTIRIFQFLKINNPERYYYLKGNDLVGWGYEKRLTVQDRGRKWFQSDLDNEYVTIRNLKDGIKKYEKLAAFLFIYVFISTLLFFLATTKIF